MDKDDACLQDKIDNNTDAYESDTTTFPDASAVNIKNFTVILLLTLKTFRGKNDFLEN